tara:strand:- start:2065 stop:3621 length:1557 start_codon:yes stop_codon:yes gene_type:complete
MPNFTLNLSMTTGEGDRQNFSKSQAYNEVFSTKQEVDNSNAFITLAKSSTAKAENSLQNVKTLIVHNEGPACAEVQFIIQGWDIASGTNGNNAIHEGDNATLGGSSTRLRYVTQILPPGEFISMPNHRVVAFHEDASPANGTVISNTAPDSNMYVAASDGSDAQLAAEAIDGSETEIDVDDGDFFRAGDIIRIENEICEVTSISTNTLTVIRGAYGSSAASHSDDVALRMAFFNAYADFDKFSTTRTDHGGRLKVSNMFGKARTLDNTVFGIVPGSFCIKGYIDGGYQELGLSGITPSTPTGLTAGTTYQFTLAVDGGSAVDLDVVVGTNTNFGGKDGVVQKIQEAIDVQYYTTSSNIFEDGVTVSIVNGDIRFQSNSNLSTSAIALGDSSGGDTDIWGVGRFPAVADAEAAVAARLPDDTITDNSTGIASPNTNAIGYDNGKGLVVGGGWSGTINYDSGALDLVGPIDCEFVYSVTYNSAHSGALNTTANKTNVITEISGRSMNSKFNSVLKLVAVN